MSDANFSEIKARLEWLEAHASGRQEFIDEILQILRNATSGHRDAAAVPTYEVKAINTATVCLPCQQAGSAPTPQGSLNQTRYGITLADKLRRLPRPEYLTSHMPGNAPPGCRWVCRLCVRRKEIKTRSSDLRSHLRKAHRYSDPEIDEVFSIKDGNTLYDHFGPCTEEQAKRNRWLVARYGRRNSRVASNDISSIASDLDAPYEVDDETNAFAMGIEDQEQISEEDLGQTNTPFNAAALRPSAESSFPSLQGIQGHTSTDVDQPGVGDHLQVDQLPMQYEPNIEGYVHPAQVMLETPYHSGLPESSAPLHWKDNLYSHYLGVPAVNMHPPSTSPWSECHDLGTSSPVGDSVFSDAVSFDFATSRL